MVEQLSKPLLELVGVMMAEFRELREEKARQQKALREAKKAAKKAKRPLRDLNSPAVATPGAGSSSSGGTLKRKGRKEDENKNSEVARSSRYVTETRSGRRPRAQDRTRG